MAQLDLVPTLAAFASRSVVSTPPRFARDYSAYARLVISVETPRLRTSDAEHDQGVSRKPSLHAIRESRIASSPRDKMFISHIAFVSLPVPSAAVGGITPTRDSRITVRSSGRHWQRTAVFLRRDIASRFCRLATSAARANSPWRAQSNVVSPPSMNAVMGLAACGISGKSFRKRQIIGHVIEALAPHANHPSARVDADLISTTGVPSNASIGPIFRRVPSTSRTVTVCSPIGFGRAGERV